MVKVRIDQLYAGSTPAIPMSAGTATKIDSNPRAIVCDNCGTWTHPAMERQICQAEMPGIFYIIIIKKNIDICTPKSYHGFSYKEA